MFDAIAADDAKMYTSKQRNKRVRNYMYCTLPNATDAVDSQNAKWLFCRYVRCVNFSYHKTQSTQRMQRNNKHCFDLFAF